MRRANLALVLLLLAATACTEPPAAGAQRDTTTTGAPTTLTPATTTTTTEPPPPPCPVLARVPPPGSGGPLVEQVTGDDPVATAISVSRATFDCATDVVVVSTADPNTMAMAARLAAGMGGPLLLATPSTASLELSAEIARLTPARVVLIGADVMVAPLAGVPMEVLDGDPATLARQVADRTGSTGAISLPDVPGPETVARTIEAMEANTALALPEPPPTTTVPAEPAVTTSTATAEPPATTTTVPVPPVADGPSGAVVTGSGQTGAVWLVDESRIDLALSVAVAARVGGGLMALVDPVDLRTITGVGQALRGSVTSPGVVHMVGDITAEASWQLPVLLEGDELPGGGYLMFPDRRLVAFYGHPSGPALGVLGEQGPEAGLARLAPIAGQYATDGVTVIPSWEIIATVADAKAGEDGNYSYETPIDDLRPWIEIARTNGMYVLLDLQPGRTDFLTQAKQYEELLLEPFVGLALDPEWRLKPNQVHLRQIGGVDASEVNAVEEWLAGLVREHHLPQKMLLLHQFQLSMLRDRDQIGAPAELAVVIQMDGQGPLHTKYETWAAVTAGALDKGWWWGWKNFYDEDTPTATPTQVLALEPVPDYVSYQ